MHAGLATVCAIKSERDVICIAEDIANVVEKVLTLQAASEE